VQDNKMVIKKHKGNGDKKHGNKQNGDKGA
jgi:hypothetical protein